MSATGLDVFDRTLQTTNIWLDEVMEAVGPDRKLAWHVLGAVLRTLRDRLPPPLAAHLGEQLPLLVRGAYYEHFAPAHAPLRLDTEDAFLAHVEAECGGTRPIKLRRAVRIVLAVLDEQTSPGLTDKLRRALPHHVRALWPEPEDVGGATVD
ncbi:MAG TPA: DUF2267 domain-containing protein [Acetobacteraceae bacterium]|nr:DUF2267 domain-containing protein [Acetobacteraceae bacterium]